MRILIVAPEVCAPWTEGRKLFVSDLARVLDEQDVVFVLTTMPIGHTTDFPVPFGVSECRWKGFHLSSPVMRLGRAIDEFAPDLVLSFPYGTFRSYYAPANKAYMSLIDGVCRRRDVPCLTIMYSIDEFSSAEKLERRVSHLAVGARAGWNGLVVDPGINTDDWPEPPAREADSKTLLFMTGLWQPTDERFEYMLEVRGLETLLRAGAALADTGLRLKVAAPMLEHAAYQERVLRHPKNTWPAGRIMFESTAAKPEIFFGADLFVFPYRLDINRFIPTSVVESMLAGTPVLLSDAQMQRELVSQGATGYLFPAGDAQSLAEAVIAAMADRSGRATIARAARSYVMQRWSVKNSARQIREIAAGIVRT